MRSLVRFGFLLLLFFLFFILYFSYCFADEKEQLRVEVNIVNVDVYAADKKGFVAGLQKENFKLLIDGKDVEIINFAQWGDTPLNIVILLDVSESIKPKFDYEKEVLINFLRKAFKKEDRLNLIQFSIVLKESGWTNDVQKLIAFLDIKPQGATRLRDALFRAGEILLTVPNPKIILLFSDFEDTASVRSWEDAERILKESLPYILALGIGGKAGTPVYYEVDTVRKLVAIISEVGGNYFLESSEERLNKIFEKVIQDLKNKYSLGFKLAAKDGLYHKIEVLIDRDIDGKPDKLKIKHREFYKAPSP